MALPIGMKVDLAFTRKGDTRTDHIAGTITDVGIDKADGANGPIGQCYTVVTLETARPENGGHQYLGERKVLTSSWAVAPRTYEVPELDSFADVEALNSAMYTQRQAAHVARIQAQEAVVAEALEALPF